MSGKRQKRRVLRKRLFTKNRLVILNEDSFEEIFSLRLTLMNVFVVAVLGAVFLIAVTTYIIAFTPLREYIPGYASTQLKREATQLALKSDSLTIALQRNEAYLESLKKVLLGDIDVAKFSKDSITVADIKDPEPESTMPSKDEIKLREQVQKEDKYNVLENAKPKTSVVFFPPATGMVTDRYNTRKKHYAVDVALPKNTPIKAAIGGNVIFADWTATTGYVIILRHADGFLTVYKHASSLTADVGDTVRTGEAIGVAGSGGAESTGIHLHFELWKDGHPVDPEKYINFE
jgi:murein DD-endopeptidase MepM/ murein hydrolase activator NlpD